MNIDRLIQDVLQKDRDAFGKIIDLYFEDIFYYVKKQVGDEEISKELCQEIFFEAYRSLKRYDSKKATFRTWLYKIANYRCVDYLRSKAYKEYHTYGEKQLEHISEPSQDILTQLIQNEQIQLVNDVMHRCLKPKQERIMRYYYYGQLSVSDISKLEKIPEKTTYTILKRSLDKLRQALGGHEYE